jgi:hypothetical protein
MTRTMVDEYTEQRHKTSASDVHTYVPKKILVDGLLIWHTHHTYTTLVCNILLIDSYGCMLCLLQCYSSSKQYLAAVISPFLP